MDKTDLEAQIRKAWVYAKALRIDEAFSGPVAHIASDSFKTLAIDPRASYEELYLSGLRESQYNILLRDFAFFQYGYGGTDGVRFAYFPNPFIGVSSQAVAELDEMREYVAEGLIEIEEFLHRASEIKRHRHPPHVRYEFSKHQYREVTHPCSHLHLGFHGENRLPVRRYLTVNAFTLLIFRLFYLNFWTEAHPIKHGAKQLTMDELLRAERSECRMLYENEFSDAEDRRFHIV